MEELVDVSKRADAVSYAIRISFLAYTVAKVTSASFRQLARANVEPLY